MNKMKKGLIALAILAFCACGEVEGEPSEVKTETGDSGISPTLVNPNATQETQRLYQLLLSQYGQKALSGVVANVDWNSREADNVHEWTGHWPAINVFDFINIHASKDVNKKGWLNYSDMTPVNAWHNAGGIVGCMWHWQVTANNGSDKTCTPGSKPKETSFDPSQVYVAGTPENKQATKDLDQVAGYLKTMQRAGIPVIWRPLHEAAGNTYEYEGGGAWFWWGAQGPEVYKKLWRWMYERLVGHHGLNNLIWVWNSQMGDNDWYPGEDVVDIVGRDNYAALQYPLMKEFKQLQNEYPHKIITLAECGNGDEVHISLWSKIWAEGSRWSWFMTWYDYAYNAGQSEEHQFAGKEWWQDAFESGTVLDRDQVKALLNK